MIVTERPITGEPLSGSRKAEDATAPRIADRLCSSFDTISFSKNESESKKSARSSS